MRLSSAYRCVSYEPISTRSPASVGDDFTSPPVLKVHRRLPSAALTACTVPPRSPKNTSPPPTAGDDSPIEPAGGVLPSQLAGGEVDGHEIAVRRGHVHAFRRRWRATSRSLRRPRRSSAAPAPPAARSPRCRSAARCLGTATSCRPAPAHRRHCQPPRSPRCTETDCGETRRTQARRASAS